MGCIYCHTTSSSKKGLSWIYPLFIFFNIASTFDIRRKTFEKNEDFW